MIRYLNIALLWLGSLGLAAIFVRLGAHGTFGQDSHAYWLALQGGDLYGSRPAELDAYLYSPLFTQALTPLGWLSWPVFRLVWLAAGVAATLWLVKPLPVRWAVPAALFAVSDLVIGNVYVFLGVMVALGARSGLPWLFGVLTKVTPGVGLLSLLARGEYRAVARSAAVLVVLVAVSYAIDPGAWVGWLRLLTSGTGGDPTLYPRCVLAVVLAVWGARRHPAWLAIAVVAATPVFNAAACLVPLLAVPRLVEQTATRLVVLRMPRPAAACNGSHHAVQHDPPSRSPREDHPPRRPHPEAPARADACRTAPRAARCTGAEDGRAPSAAGSAPAPGHDETAPAALEVRATGAGVGWSVSCPSCTAASGRCGQQL